MISWLCPACLLTLSCSSSSVASKTAALNKAEEWVKSQPNLTFDVIHIHPSFIFGRDSLALDAAGLASSTNGLLLRLALGGWDDNFTAASFAFCSLRYTP